MPHLEPDIPNRPGVYVITNTVNGKQYVGSSTKMAKRWTMHRRNLRDGVHHTRHLQAAWDKYGPKAFTCAVLEEVAETCRLHEREQYYTDLLHPAYNKRLTVESNLGFRFSLESRANIRASRLGKRHSEETRQKLSRLKRGIPANLTDAQRETMREERAARWADPEYHARVVAKLRGQHRSAETRAKIAAANLGAKRSEAARAAMRLAQLGKTPSEEARAKRAESMRARWADPDSRAAMLAARERKRVAR